MSTFKVIEILESNKIKVYPEWVLSRPNSEDITGDEISIQGISDSINESIFKRLKTLLLGKTISVVSPFVKESGGQVFVGGKVLLDDTDIVYYFPEFKSNDHLIESC